MFGNITNSIKKIRDLKQELENEKVEGSSGAGQVKMVLDGNGNIFDLIINIDDEDISNKDIVRDLIIAAHDDAKGKLKVVVEEKMKEATSGLPIPPGLLF